MAELDEILDRFAHTGWESEPVEHLIPVVEQGHALEVTDRLLDLSSATTRSQADLVLELLISFVPIDDLGAVVAAVVDRLQGPTEPSGHVGDLIPMVALQHPEAVRPLLSEIWDLQSLISPMVRAVPWRAADEVERGRLLALLEAATGSDERWRIRKALVESRSDPGLLPVIEDDPDKVESSNVVTDRGVAVLLELLEWVGYGLVDGSVARLCVDRTYHLQWEPAYVGQAPAIGRTRSHPTWFDLGPPMQTCQFGGRLDATCLVCGSALHQLLVLDPVPDDLGISTRSRLTFTTCNTCEGYSEDALYYTHDERGEPNSIGHDEPPREPPFPAEHLTSTLVALVATPERWRQQHRDLSDGQNLHRLGGEPTWVQGPYYPPCKGCERTMRFVLQLDSNLDCPPPESGYTGWLWGSGGLVYFFWCDSCAISACHWQGT